MEENGRKIVGVKLKADSQFIGHSQCANDKPKGSLLVTIEIRMLLMYYLLFMCVVVRNHA